MEHISSTIAHIDIAEALQKGPPPDGNLAVPIFAHGTLAVELYTPQGHDPQQPHDRDEIYVVARGTGLFFEEWGYGAAVGIGNLSEAVEWTLTVRQIDPDYPMPKKYVLLHDWDEAGYVLMDTATVNAEGEPRVLWVSDPPHEEEEFLLNSYATFAEWSVFRLEEEKEFLEGTI